MTGAVRNAGYSDRATFFVMPMRCNLNCDVFPIYVHGVHASGSTNFGSQVLLGQQPPTLEFARQRLIRGGLTHSLSLALQAAVPWRLLPSVFSMS